MLSQLKTNYTKKKKKKVASFQPVPFPEPAPGAILTDTTKKEEEEGWEGRRSNFDQLKTLWKHTRTLPHFKFKFARAAEHDYF